MKPDRGIVALQVLRILAHGARSLADVQAALPQWPSPRVAHAVEKMTADGLVMTKRKRLELTRAGKLAAPSTAPQLASHGQYVPPRVVRRAGTEIHRTLPSVRGGQRYYRSEA